MSAGLFTEVKLQGESLRPAAGGEPTPSVTWTAGDRCTCCHSADLPQCSSHTADETHGEMLSPVCSEMCSYSPAAAQHNCCSKAEECEEFSLTCQREARDDKSHEFLG